jgi:ATP-dependent DNA ligase
VYDFDDAAKTAQGNDPADLWRRIANDDPAPRAERQNGAEQHVDPGDTLCTVLSFVSPMLATDDCPGGTLDGWVVEPKAEGWRAQVVFDVDGLRVSTRQGRDITSTVPELAAIAEVGVGSACSTAKW